MNLVEGSFSLEFKKRRGYGMNKRTIKMTSYLALLLLLIQMINPFAAAFAATNSNMLPPSNLAVQQVTPDDVKLTWSSVFGATGYNVYEIQEGQLNLLGNSTSPSFNLNNLSEGTTRYVVSTMSPEGESGPSAPVSVEILYPEMIAPSTLTQTIKNGNDIALSWGSSAYSETNNLYQLSVDGQKTLVTTTQNKTTFTVNNAPEGNFIYAVTAVNALYGESPLSESVQVEVVYPTIKAPANFTYSVTNGSDITFKWNAAANAANYKLYQIVDGQPVLKNTVVGTSVKLTNVQAGDYEYEIRSNSDRFGESGDSSKVSVTVGTVSMTAPGNFTYKLENTNDVVLAWDTVPYANSYKVYQIIDGEKVLKSMVTGTGIKYSKMPSGNYIYEVYSYSTRYGESAEGSRAELTVDEVLIQAPASLEYKIQNGNDVVLNWIAADNATSYKVYQIVDDQKVLKSTVTGTSATLANRTAGSYKFEVYSLSDRFGESKEGSSVSFELIHPTMKAPANLKETIKTDTSFTLSWDTTEYATDYRIYQIIAGQKTLKKTVTASNNTFTNMPSGDYVYEIHSYSSKFGESNEGSKVSFTLKGQTMLAPQDLSHTITNGNDIKLNWTDVEKATSYKVYQIINGEKVLKSSPTSESIAFSNSPAGDYTFVVHSYSTTHGESEYGTEISFKLIYPTIHAPENTAYQIKNGNDVVLSWNVATFATGYKVYELVDGQKVLKSSPTALTTTLSKVPAGEHMYVIHSVSSRFGESTEGTLQKVTVDEHTMEAPQNVTSSIANGNDLTLRWEASIFATSYKVYQEKNGQLELVKTTTGPSTTFANMPKGDYKYIVHSYSDRFNESPVGSEIVGTMVYPTMQAPGNLKQSIVNGNDIKLTWDAAAYATGYKVYQNVNGELILTKTVPSTTVTFFDMPEGDYEYEVRSYSDRFAESPVGSTVGINVIWPVVEPPVLTSKFTNVNNVELTWKSVTWANEYRVYQTVGGSQTLVYKGTALKANVYNLVENTHSFEVRAYSTRFGESQPSNAITQKIVYPEMQPPTATVTVLSNSSARIVWDFVTYANGYNIYEIVDGKAVLVAGKVNNLSYTINNLSYANHEFYVTSQSNSFGESKPSNTVLAKLIVDTEAPVTISDAPTDWTNKRPVITLSASDNETGVATTYYSVDESDFIAGTNISIEEEGIHKVSFYSVDKVGNKEAIKTINIKFDKTAPVTKESVTPAWSNLPITITLASADVHSGVAATYYSINGSEYMVGTELTLDKEGINEVSFYSIDKAGNKENPQTVEISLDQTAPVTLSNVGEQWFNDQFIVELTATDDFSDVQASYYSINGSEYQQGTSFELSKEGINEISFYSIDNAGNKEEVKTAKVKIDKSAPATISNSTDEWHQEFTVEFTSKDELSGADSTYYSVNGSEFAEGNSLLVNEEGINVITFYSVDNAGNKEEVKTAEVKIDKSAPVTSSNATTEWQQEFTLEFTAKDDLSGEATTFYSVNGSDFTKGNNVAVKEEGINVITFYSVDNAGNKEEVKTAEVKIDKSAPETTSNASDFWVKESFAVELTAADSQSGLSSTYYSINGSEYVEGKSFTVNKEGINVITFYSVDKAGNKEEVQTIEVKIDKTAPTVTWELKEIYTLGTKLQLAYTAKDAESGIKTESLTVNGEAYKNGDIIDFTKPGKYTVRVTVTDHVGLTTTLEKTIVVYIHVSTIKVNPGVIKDNGGVFTVDVSLPRGFDTKNFILETVTINGVSALSGKNGYEKQAEKGQFKFNRDDFDWSNGKQTLEFSGMVGDYLVLGTTEVEVKGSKK